MAPRLERGGGARSGRPHADLSSPQPQVLPDFIEFSGETQTMAEEFYTSSIALQIVCPLGVQFSSNVTLPASPANELSFHFLAPASSPSRG